MRFTTTVLLIYIASALGDNCDVASVVKSNKIFSVNVYKELVKQFGNNNFIYSGFSAETILSLLANGAKGPTLTQLLRGLSLPENLKVINNANKEILSRLKTNETDLKLLSANKIFLAQNFSILDKFKDTAVNDYDSDVQNVDYRKPEAAAQIINQWVEQQTNNKITNMIDPTSLSPSTSVVLVNALYFSGRWQHEFKTQMTKKRDFKSVTGTKQIDMMYTEAITNYGYNDKLRAKFLELTTHDEKVSVVFILPDSLNGLSGIEKNLGGYLEKQVMQEVAVAITLPKFKISSDINFKPILQSMGVKNVFANNADLSGISEGSSLVVDFVLQKAFVDINEEGVEAAASTAIGVTRMSAITGEVIKYKFTADHPFLFYIKENTLDVILFIGRFNQ